MTSYASANDSNNTAATMSTASTTTPMSATAAAAAAGVVHDDATSSTLLLTSPPPPLSPSTVATINATSTTFTALPLECNKLTANTTTSTMQQAHHNNDCCYDYDCDSLSDGLEKTDTTPENIKKIDDVIEQQQQQQRSLLAARAEEEATAAAAAAAATQYHHHTRLLTADSPTGSTTSTSNIGLAVALDFDDSTTRNAKFRFAKTSLSLSSQQKDTLNKTNEHIEESHDDDNGKSSTKNNNNNSHKRSIDHKSSNSSNNYNNSNNNSNSPSNDNNEIKMDNKMLFITRFGSEPTTNDDDDSTASNTTTAANKQSYSFTIDNFNDKDSDPAATAAKYKNMLERFQSRHRRGASMSKLESEVGNSAGSGALTSSASAAPLTSTSTITTTTVTLRNSRNADTAATESADAVPKVKLRARDRSTSRMRDASKRHSWSPRSSSTQEQQQLSTVQQQALHQPHHPTHKPLPPSGIATTTASAKRRTAGTKTKPPPLQMPKGAANLVANRTRFTPRSTAMQMALQKVDFLCSQPPLGDFKHLTASDADNVSEAGTYTLDGDNYTEEQKEVMNIDMSGGRRHRPKDLQLHSSDSEAITNGSKIPVHRTSNVLEVNCYHEAHGKQQQQQQQQILHSPRFTQSTTGGNDLLMGSHQSAGAYLEKIKSRVLRNMSATKSASVVAASTADCDISANKYLSGSAGDGGSGNGSQKSGIGVSAITTEEEDMGCFTSVTTSGVLAKQGALDPRPKLTRKSSLSTSQIDSSEYVSNEAKLKNPKASAYAAGGFTDHQKAEYRLNLFTNQKDTQKFAATRSYIESPPETPTTPKHSDTAVLKTAQTKNDWIQEWARNARARSLANETKQRHPSAVNNEHTQDLMTRSYTCSDTGGNDGNSLTDDSIYSKQQWAAEKINKSLAERYRLAGGECDYSSDPMISCTTYVKSHQQEAVCKPPKSPSKIPSPMHSLGRARSASRTRASLQNMLSGGEDGDGDSDIYLQKTAAAINNLQQTLSRKNSLKSPTHSASPRAHSARVASRAIYSPEEFSPQHSLDSPTALNTAYHHHHRSPMHQQRQHRHPNDAFTRTTHAQHLQLMTSSFNEQQLALLTSGEYLARQMRMRKNSFDGGNGGNSPARRVVSNAQVQTPCEQKSLSPLRRSNSFSAKIATQQRAARPQFQNIYTPPAARHHNYGGGDGVYQQQQQHQNVASNNAAAIKKSASSNNFRQVYSDYDDNLQYYINDEDDMAAEEYYSSGGEEEDSYYKDDFEDEDMHADENVNTGGGSGSGGGGNAGPPISNTRYNKALLMRIERSKQKVARVGGVGGKINSAPPLGTIKTAAGLVACPNTPELPRRGIKSAPRAGVAGAGTTRQSMPRDASLSRLANQVPNSLASAKKQLLQTAAAGVPTAALRSSSTSAASNQRVQPKYLDISKYKPAQGNNFLRKNDSKSTLNKQSTETMKRSPSSSSMGLSRSDATRTSNRSVRSVTSCMTTSGTSLGGSGRASSAVRRDASIAKQKEAEMAMWKRRSTYDPMKAAAEDRRKKEEAKRLAVAKGGGVGEVPCESSTRNNTHQQSLEEEQWALGESEYGEDGEEDGECV